MNAKQERDGSRILHKHTALQTFQRLILRGGLYHCLDGMYDLQAEHERTRTNRKDGSVSMQCLFCCINDALKNSLKSIIYREFLPNIPHSITTGEDC